MCVWDSSIRVTIDTEPKDGKPLSFSFLIDFPAPDHIDVADVNKESFSRLDEGQIFNYTRLGATSDQEGLRNASITFKNNTIFFTSGELERPTSLKDPKSLATYPLQGVVLLSWNPRLVASLPRNKVTEIARTKNVAIAM